MTRFVGKRAIVTGAGSGIGAALCRALADAGADVLCTDIDGVAAEHTAASLSTRGTALQLDVTDATAVQQAVDGVVERAGRIDLLFNNAGITWGGDTELLTLDQWNNIIDVNIRGVVHGCTPPTRRWSASAAATSSTPHRWRVSRQPAGSPAT